MALVFYFAPMSTASVTEAVLGELGVECERVQLDIRSGDTRKPEFLAVNPNGRVPTIVHDGVAIWESAAITMYLGEQFGVDAELYPAAGTERGEAMKWIVWAAVTLAEAGARLAAALPPGSEGGVEDGSVDEVSDADASAQRAAAAKAREDVGRCLSILDGALEGRSFLVGERYSLADTHVCVIVGWLAMMGADWSACERVAAWIGRCSERPPLEWLARAGVRAEQGGSE